MRRANEIVLVIAAAGLAAVAALIEIPTHSADPGTLVGGGNLFAGSPSTAASTLPPLPPLLFPPGSSTPVPIQPPTPTGEGLPLVSGVGGLIQSISPISRTDTTPTGPVAVPGVPAPAGHDPTPEHHPAIHQPADHRASDDRPTHHRATHQPADHRASDDRPTHHRATHHRPGDHCATHDRPTHHDAADH